MTAPLALLALVLAAPLEVRVLERETPSRVRLSAPALRCDGKPLPPELDVEAGVRELRAGALICQEVTAPEGATVTAKGLTRRYPGALTVSLAGGLLRLVVRMDLEAYLPSVVQAEASGARAAALEAQAIVSRTFALASAKRHAADGYHLCDLAHCQVYRGEGEVSPEARAAVAKTKGQVLLVGGVALRPAFFHAACGGHTSHAQDVFEENAAGSAVSDVEGGAPRCASHPDFTWTFEVEREALARALGVPARGAAVEPLRRDAAGRVVALRSFTRRYAGNDFLSRVGRALGWQALRSMKWVAMESDTTVRFTGTGAGHGVGLCQQGARALAERGVSADGILRRYFPESRVRAWP